MTQTSNDPLILENKTPTDKFFDLFWHLANNDKQIRIKACVSLLRTLLKATKNNNAANGDINLLNKKDSERFNNVIPELSYTLVRLSKGLLSSRNAAREGFALAFSEILRYFPNISLKDIVGLIEEEIIHAKSNPEVKEKDRFIALVLAVSSIVRSNRIETILEGDNEEESSLTIELICNLTNTLIEKSLGKKSNIYGELASEALVTLLDHIPDTYWENHLKQIFEKILTIQPSNMDPSYLSVILHIYERFNSSIYEFNSNDWSEGHPLNKDNIKVISSILLKTNVHNRLHNIWKHIVKSILNFKSNERKEILSNFIEYIIHEFIDHSLDLNFIAMSVIMQMLPMIDREDFYVVLSPKIVLNIARNTGKVKKHMKELASQFITTLEEIGKTDQDKSLAIVISLQNLPGEVKFDTRTKTTCVENLVKGFTDDTFSKYFKKTADSFCSYNDEDSNYIDSRRKRFISDLYDTAKLANQEVSFKILQFLFFHAYYVYNGENESKKKRRSSTSQTSYLKNILSSPLSDKVRAHIISRFQHLLDFLRSKDSDENKTSIQSLLAFENSLIKDNSFHTVNTLIPEYQSLKEKMNNEVSVLDSKLQKEKDEKAKKLLTSFRDLLLFSQLTIYDNQDISIYEDLIQCIQKILNPPKKSRRSSKTQNELNPIEVLTEVFLALILRSTCYIKSVIESTWKNLDDKINPQSLQMICDAIENTEEFIGGDEDEEGEEDEEVDENDDDGNDNEDENDEEEENEEQDEDMEIEDVENEEDIEDEDDLNDEAMDEESEESVALDDEAMFKLDEMIANVFSKMGSIPKRDLKKLSSFESQVLDFKYKALSLLDIYVETHSTNSNIFLIIMPLIRSIFDKPANNLRTLFSYRANASLNRFIKIKQYPKDDLPVDLLHEILEKSYSCLLKCSDSNTANLMKNVICFVNKILLTSDNGLYGNLDVQKESKYFSEALSSFISSMKSDKKNKVINIDLFLDILRRDWRLAFEFFDDMMEAISNSSSGQFRSILFIKILSNVITKNICSNNKEKFYSLAPSIKNAFIVCNSDKHISPLNRIKCYELMINAFKIMINLFGFEDSKKLWNIDELIESLTSTKKSQGKVAKSMDKLINYLKTGNPNPTPSKVKSESK